MAKENKIVDSTLGVIALAFPIHNRSEIFSCQYSHTNVCTVCTTCIAMVFNREIQSKRLILVLSHCLPVRFLSSSISSFLKIQNAKFKHL